MQFVNYRRPILTIQKIDEATGLGIDGVVIRVWTDGMDEYMDYTTSGGGYIRLENQSPGTVICKEIKSAPGYLLSDEEHRVTLEPGGRHQLTIKNQKIPTLTLRKVDERTPSQGIAGVTFRFMKDGEFRDVTTGPNGVISVSLDPGWWTYEETSVPNGWILDPTPGHVEFVAGQDKEIVVTNRHKPSLRIVKLDSVTKQPLQYVTFEIAYKNGKVLGEFTTNESGEIYLEDIDPGLLVITETKSRPGYRIDAREKEALVEWGKVVTVEFFNTPINPLLIRKIDTVTGEPLPDAVFSVTTVNGAYVGEYTTGRNGFITVTGVDPGFYVVKEIKSPRGLHLKRYTEKCRVEAESARRGHIREQAPQRHPNPQS